MFLRQRKIERFEEEKKDKKMHAPRPNVGDCAQTGEWRNPSMIEKCQQCVGTPGYYGEVQFYCNGKCMSEYNTSQHCSMSSLVAKTVDQCFAPCVQQGSPSLGGCSDDYDCKDGKVCQNGKCVPPGSTENFEGDFDYSLNMYSSKNDWNDDQKKLFIGVL